MSAPESPPIPATLWTGPRWPAIVWPLLAFGLPMLLYLVTCCRTLYVGDAGDFVVASWTLGMAHPPGYPLYTLLGWVMTHLPIPGGESAPAFRLNLMSSLFGALTCLFVYLSFARVSNAKPLALLAALAVAVSRTFWWQSNITEVYSLNTFFIALLWWLTIRFAENGERRWWQWLLLTMSLSLAHHYSILMFFPFMAGYIWWRRGAIFPGQGRISAPARDVAAEEVIKAAIGPRLQLPLASELMNAAILLILPMVTLYLYLPLVNYKTPVSEGRQGVLYNTPAEEFRYVVFDVILRGIYSNKAQFANATTTPQVIEHYLKYIVGDPFRQMDSFESGDLGTLAMGILLALWAAFLWKPRTPEDLPENLQTGIDLPRLRQLVLMFLGCLAIFFTIVCFYPSGDILAAPQTNLKVVMPPLLIPGQLFLVLAIFMGAIAFWHHLPSYAWRNAAKDPMPPVQKVNLSRQLLVATFAALVLVNSYNNWPGGDRSGAMISWNYPRNVVRSLEPDTLVMNTGDETFLYWYLEKVHWDLYPEERPEQVVFTNWIHQIPSYAVLQAKTEAELQRDIIAFFLKQQMVERAARKLQMVASKPHQLNFVTTFFRPEFLQVPFFRYWQVQMDGLVYKWSPRPEYEPIIIQDILQTNAEMLQRNAAAQAEGVPAHALPETDILGEQEIMLLGQYLTTLLIERSPKFAARVNLDAGRPAEADGAAALAPVDQVGPIVQDPLTQLWAGPTPSERGPSDPQLLILSDDTGAVIYQLPELAPLDIELIERDWWELYDWRGILGVRHTQGGVEIDPPQVSFDAQEEEILSRFQDMFVQHALKHYRESARIQVAIDALDPATGEDDPARTALQDEFLESMLEADRYVNIAVKFPFVHNVEMSAVAWGLLGDIKLTLGQFDVAITAFEYLSLRLDPAQYPTEAARARANWAFAANAMGQRQRAEQLIHEALLIDPGNALATQLQQRWKSGSTEETTLPPSGPPPGSGFVITEPPAE